MALSYLEPGLSPTTTKEVFFETDPVTFAPRLWRASFAPSLVCESRVPVTTTVSPSSGLGPSSSPAPSSSIRTPASRHLRRISRCHSSANHAFTEAAMIGPTPSASDSSCSVASSIRSMDRN